MTKYNMGVLSTLAFLISTLSACSSDAPVDLGEKNLTLSKSDLAAYAANWDGYVEAYQFEDGSDRVRLVLDNQGHGSVRFGNRELIGPATDPTAYYPPQASQSNMGGQLIYWSGFGYTAQNARVESERIRFESSRLELYSSYCAVQTPYALAAPAFTTTGYACLPYYMLDIVINSTGPTCTIPASLTNSGWTQGDPTVDVPCEQLAMCRGVCTCTATGCSVDTPNPGDLSVDAALDDTETKLEGTLLLDGQRITVRLKRQ